MSLLIEQTDILEKMSQIIYSNVDIAYDLIILKIELDTVEGWSDIECNFKYGDTVNETNLDASSSWRLHQSAEELHKLMKAHTGGEWRSFTLTLDADGKAHTKFHYPKATLQQ